MAVAVVTIGASALWMSYFHETPTDAASRSSERRELELALARDLFEAFAGFAPPRVAIRRVDRSIPDVLVDMGALRGVVYTKDLGGAKRTYIHFMDDPPRLMCDPQGRQLYVLGGSYRITRRGIEG